MAFLGVYGHVNVDHILLTQRLPEPETTLPVESSLVRLGGTGGNIARAATALGVPTALAACVGDDFPPAYLEALERAGIDVTDVRRVAGSTPRVWILSAAGGDQSTIIDQGVMADGVQRPSLEYTALNSTWVHLTTGAPSDWQRIADLAHEARRRVAFDPAQELAYRYHGRTFETLLNRAEVFFANEHELGRALELLGYGDPVQLFDHTPRVVVTRGAKGTRLLTPKETIEVEACPVRGLDRVEPTGAGDVFRGGVYAGLHRGQDWRAALRAGSAAAALFLEARGERFPDWPAVAARLDEWTP